MQMWSNPPITNTAVPSLPRRERRINTDITNTPEVENLLNHLKVSEFYAPPLLLFEIYFLFA